MTSGYTRTVADELRATARQLTESADRLSGKRGDQPLAVDVFAGMTPQGARLYASQAHGGRWWSYVIMPKGWRPAEVEQHRHRWLHNTQQDHYWDTLSGETEEECLRKGLLRLLEAN